MCEPTKGKPKCMRAGPITRNGYLNFLRVFRRTHCGLSVVDTIKAGAEAWNKMSCKEKDKYRLQACALSRKKAKRRPKRNGKCRPKPRKRTAARRPARGKKSKAKRSCLKRRAKPRKKSLCGKKRNRCSRPGPITNNGYLNFLRSFRRKNCHLKGREAISKGARQWHRLSQQQKDRYNRMACKVTTSIRRRGTKLCRGVLRRSRRRKC